MNFPTLQNELSNVCSILINNGYFEAVINTAITKKINQFRRPTQLGPKKCPVYFHLPWLVNTSMRYEMQIKTAVKRCYFAVEPCIVYTTTQLLPAPTKNVLSASHQSNIVYQFLCHCDSRYVGRTSQRLQQRIKQHVPKTILQEHISQDRSTLARSCKQITSFKAETSFSAIGQHFLQNPTCAREYLMITNFLFLPVAVLLFIFPLLKPRTSKHPNQIYANKKNSFMV